MDRSQSSYSRFDQDDELPTKEDTRTSNYRRQSLDAFQTGHSSGGFDQFRDEIDQNSSRRSSKNGQARSSVENVIDAEGHYSGDHRHGKPEYQTQYDEECHGRCRHQTIQTCPGSILKNIPHSSERSFDYNQSYKGRRERQCPFSEQTTTAPTSGYSIYNVPSDCQKVTLTSNKKLQTSEENLSKNNIRYYCTNSARPKSSQTVDLQDSRGDTNIRESPEPAYPKCRCCPVNRETEKSEYQYSKVALSEYNQPQSGCSCPEDRSEPYFDKVDSDYQDAPAECRCCSTIRSKPMQKCKYQQPKVPGSTEAEGRRYCVPDSYSNEPERPECCSSCPGYTSKRRTSRSITCNPSLTPRSIQCSPRYHPSEVGDIDQNVIPLLPPSPRRQNRRCNRQPVPCRRMPPVEPPPWCSPDCRKPKSKPKRKCICSCCCRGELAPPPPPLPEFFYCLEEEGEDIYGESSDISDDDCFCDDLSSPVGLSYQDNEEYQELLMELEEALACRNRNRVRRAIQEFEHRSRLNKPLERPIIDYDETSRSEEPLIEKLSQLRNSRKNGRQRERLGCSRRSQSRGEKEYQQEEYSRPLSSKGQYRTASKTEEPRRSKWKMDETGEWYKSPRSLKRSSRSSSPRKGYHDDMCACCVCKVYNRTK
ncbi:unnamed protein product [Acanthoscelides obtectus]|nr:unnamed protein product [Acanthoscelides obtectus]CAK1625895.1 hypothetical protein AOBTE_LOCUS3460 [Acanthoscelides obtectus]